MKNEDIKNTIYKTNNQNKKQQSLFPLSIIHESIKRVFASQTNVKIRQVVGTKKELSMYMYSQISTGIQHTYMYNVD